jgi:hypothetical protein
MIIDEIFQRPVTTYHYLIYQEHISNLIEEKRLHLERRQVGDEDDRLVDTKLA